MHIILFAKETVQEEKLGYVHLNIHIYLNKHISLFKKLDLAKVTQQKNGRGGI